MLPTGTPKFTTDVLNATCVSSDAWHEVSNSTKERRGEEARATVESLQLTAAQTGKVPPPELQGVSYLNPSLTGGEGSVEPEIGVV